MSFRHSTIFQVEENLPTFNSVAIESQLANIPDLSDYFIYKFRFEFSFCAGWTTY